MEKTYLDYKNQGNIQYKANNYQKAIQQYQKAIKFTKEEGLQNKAIYHNLALCYYKLQKYQQSTQCCSKAIELDVHYSKAYYRRLHCSMKMDRHYQAYIDGLLFLSQCKPQEKAQVQQLNIQNKQKFLKNIIDLKSDDEFFMQSLKNISKVQQQRQQLEKSVQKSLKKRHFWQALNYINHEIMKAQGESKQNLQEYYKKVKEIITKLKNKQQQFQSQQNQQKLNDSSINQSTQQNQISPVEQIIHEQKQLKAQKTNQNQQNQAKEENTQNSNQQQITGVTKEQSQQLQDRQNQQNLATNYQQLNDLYKKHVESYLNQSRDNFQDFFKMNEYLFTKSHLPSWQIRALILQIRGRVGDLKILVKGISKGQKQKIVNYFKEKGLEDLLYIGIN